jgi:catechol 2,3-dioxygenase-like lactoylglutathione lyase family enzyme
MKATFFATVFHVSDLEKALTFYTQILGFEPSFKLGHYAGICAGELSIHLCGPDNPGYKKPVGAGHICIGIQQVDDYYQHLQAQQVPITYPIGDRHYSIRDFAIEDPDGNTLIFGQTIEEIH